MFEGENVGVRGLRRWAVNVEPTMSIQVEKLFTFYTFALANPCDPLVPRQLGIGMGGKD